MDSAELDVTLAGWADYYGKVNLRYSNNIEFGSHIQPLGPSFGVRSWNFTQSILIAVAKAVRRGLRHIVDVEDIKDIYRQWRHRLPIREYVPKVSDRGYIFFTGSLWKKEPYINEARANFVRVCRGLKGVRFEGGMAPRTNKDLDGFGDITCERRFELDDYISRVQKSALVFNTPGVLSCLGWKLAEFMALGKAIISLPLQRVMPAPVLHGIHMHFVQSAEKEVLRDAIEKILQDEEYRWRLEAGSREYFDMWLTPLAVALRIRNYLEGGQQIAFCPSGR